MSHVFMSYSRRDTAVVDSIVERLEKAGIEVWIDREDIHAGRQWRTQIVEAIDTAKAFVLNISEHSISSINVLKELNLAEEASDPFVLPVLLQDVRLPTEMRYQLAGIQHILYFIDPEKAYDNLEAILKERMGVLGESQPEMREIEIVLKGKKVSDFNEAKKQQLLALLAEATGVPVDQLAVKRIELGSLHIFVDAPTRAGYTLKALALNQDKTLANAGIEKLRFIGDKRFILIDGSFSPQSSPKKPFTKPLAWGLAGIFLAAALLIANFLSAHHATIPTKVETQTAKPILVVSDTLTPTATFEPTRTPTITTTPTATFTPTPTEVVKFWTDPSEIPAGSYTTINWQVENVQKVIFGGKEQPLEGSTFTDKLCANQTYTLTVIRLNGTESYYKTGVTVKGVCVTPTYTPTKPPPDTPPPAPVLISPPNKEVITCSSTTTLSWNPVFDENGISQYQVVMMRSFDGINFIAFPGGGYYTSGTSINVSTVDCIYYRWHVRAYDGNNNVGPWSAWWTFLNELH